MVSMKKVFLSVVVCSLMGTVNAETKTQTASKQATKASDTTANEQAKKTNTPSVTKDVNTHITVGDVVSSGQAKIDLEVRYVNTMEAMQTCKKGIEVSGQLEQKRKEFSDEIKQKEQKVTQAMSEFKSKESTMSQSARNAEEAKIVKMRGELETIVKSREAELKLAMQQATEELALDVEKAIGEIAMSEGYDIVADVYTGRTIYASKKAMITEDLISKMDNKHKSVPASKQVATA